MSKKIGEARYEGVRLRRKGHVDYRFSVSVTGDNIDVDYGEAQDSSFDDKKGERDEKAMDKEDKDER